MRKSRPFTITTEADRKRALDHIGALSLGKPWQMTIGPLTRRRTLSQNSLMWAWLNEVAEHISDHTGYETHEVHEFCKHLFLPAKRVMIGGREVEYWTTTDLTTHEMSEYMEKIYRWASSELGLFLPSPELGHLA